MARLGRRSLFYSLFTSPPVISMGCCHDWLRQFTGRIEDCKGMAVPSACKPFVNNTLAYGSSIASPAGRLQGYPDESGWTLSPWRNQQ